MLPIKYSENVKFGVSPSEEVTGILLRKDDTLPEFYIVLKVEKGKSIL